MSFWRTFFGFDEHGPNHAGVTPNANDPADVPPASVGPPDWQPGDPNQVEFDIPNTYSRAQPFPQPSPWSGWPEEWSTPYWDTGHGGFGGGYGGFQTALGFNRLVDTAWACLDLNSSVLAAMPVYRMRSGEIIAPTTWMENPDPSIYGSWYEFAKQLFWDYQCGEAFVLPMAFGADRKPSRFRVVPPWLINIEMNGGTRRYDLGGQDVTSEILHIRYQSDTSCAHGRGPLEVAGARIVAAGLLQRYATKIAETGGTPLYWLEVARRLNQTEADDLLDTWVQSRRRRAGEPALVTGGATLKQAEVVSARNMTLLELAQFSESRIAVLLGVPPYVLSMPVPGGSGESITYSNASQLFSFHDRAWLKPKAVSVMTALSQWALPHGQTAELNRDEYTRPDLESRAKAYKIFIDARVLAADEVRLMERFLGEGPAALSGTETPDTIIAAPQQQTAPAEEQ